jgi:hypothetical protein
MDISLWHNAKAFSMVFYTPGSISKRPANLCLSELERQGLENFFGALCGQSIHDSRPNYGKDQMYFLEIFGFNRLPKGLGVKVIARAY